VRLAVVYPQDGLLQLGGKEFRPCAGNAQALPYARAAGKRKQVYVAKGNAGGCESLAQHRLEEFRMVVGSHAGDYPLPKGGLVKVAGVCKHRYPAAFSGLADANPQCVGSGLYAKADSHVNYLVA
jgi:hypothetical protein